MRRRDFIAFLGATAWIVRARAQEPLHVIGFMSGFSYPGMSGGPPHFYQGLKEIGFVEGKNINVEFRWVDGHYDRLPSFAAEFVRRNVSLILADDLPSALAAKAATKTIPIVFATGADPIKVGLVKSFSEPNENLTGVSFFLVALGPKRLELLHELLPALNQIALLGNPANANFQPDVLDIRAAADALRQRLEVLTASTEGDLETAFVTMAHLVSALSSLCQTHF